jgi:meso-butanediol dehydrogenase/(S,S)-butanediol dehydrogenase/diacetyl reductase
MAEDGTGALDGRVVVVTGGGQGLGRALTRALVKAGAKVAILGRTRSKLDALAEELGAAVLPIAADLAEPNAVRAAFSEIVDRFGHIDALVNNAAIYDFFKIAEATDEQMSGIVNANLLGPMYCIRSATPLLKEAGGGDIINITSEAVLLDLPFLNAYGATKAGLERLSRGLSEELRGDRIRVSTLRLGVMADPDRVNVFDMAVMQRCFAEATEKGFRVFASKGMALDSVASVIVHMLSAPRDAIHNLVELRDF